MDPGKEGPLAKEDMHKAPSTVTSTQGVSDPPVRHLLLGLDSDQAVGGKEDQLELAGVGGRVVHGHPLI